MKTAEQLVHPFPPTWDEHSEILILGSFPSVKSRETAFFYGHPQNRFWRLVAALYEDAVPQTVEERRALQHPGRRAERHPPHSRRGSGSRDLYQRADRFSAVPAVPSPADRQRGGLSSLHQPGQRCLVL